VAKTLEPIQNFFDYLTEKDEFDQKVAKDEAEFRPPGTKVHEYTLSNGRTFEIYQVYF
jgi:hypothetical protein